MTFNTNGWGLMAIVIMCGCLIRIVEIIFNDIMVVRSIKNITNMSKEDRDKLLEKILGKDVDNESND